MKYLSKAFHIASAIRMARNQHSGSFLIVEGETSDFKVYRNLTAPLSDEDSQMRAYAALFLMHFDDQRVIQRLTEALEDPDSWVRHYARLSLGVLKIERSSERPKGSGGGTLAG
jgi:hypothetical protein